MVYRQLSEFDFQSAAEWNVHKNGGVIVIVDSDERSTRSAFCPMHTALEAPIPCHSIQKCSCALLSFRFRLRLALFDLTQHGCRMLTAVSLQERQVCESQWAGYDD